MSTDITDEQTLFLNTGRREGHAHALVMLDALIRAAAAIDWQPPVATLRLALAFSLEHGWHPARVIARRVRYISAINTIAGEAPAFFADSVVADAASILPRRPGCTMIYPEMT